MLHRSGLLLAESGGSGVGPRRMGLTDAKGGQSRSKGTGKREGEGLVGRRSGNGVRRGEEREKEKRRKKEKEKISGFVWVFKTRI